MSRVIQIQTNFASGALDPLLRARIDLQQYYNALETAENVFCLPQGGIKRRDGLKFIFQLPSGANPQDGVALIPFEFSAADTYMFCVTAGRIYVFRNQALVTNINSSGNDFITASSITGAMLDKLRFAQSADTMILVHEDLPPQKLVRGADHDEWTLSALTFTNAPKHAFTITTTNPPGSITPNASIESIKLTASSSIFHDGQTGTAQAGGSDTITLDSGALATNDIYNGSTIRITGGTGSGQKRVISDYVGSSKVATVSVAWTTQPDSTSTFAVESHVGQFIQVTKSYGRMRIVNVISATSAEVFAEVALFDDSAISSGDYEFELGYEDAWSTERGYPKSITFHEGRLWFAGSRSLPTTFWGSTVNNFFDFDLGESLDDQAIIGSITTDSLNAIVDIHSGRDLQIFTTASEFFLPQTTSEPITPSNITVKVGTRNGARPGVPVAGLDSGTLYVQRLGKSLNEMVFTDAELSYTTSAISLLSGHLLKTPIDMAIRRATSTEEADRLFIVNAADGSIACYSLLRSQQVVAPTVLKTAGTFEAVGVDLDTVYVVCKRTINSATVYYVEAFDATLHTDSAVFETLTPFVATTITHTVTVSNPGSGNKFFIDGVQQATLTLVEGNTYVFNYPSAHPFRFSTTSDGTHGGGSEFTTGVTHNSSTQLTFVVPSGAPDLFYFCSLHSGMGGAANTPAPVTSLPTGTAAHLEGATLDVVVDGVMQSQKTVSSGSVTFDRAAATNSEIGLPFTMTAKTMPCETRLASGNIRAFKKRILEVNAEVFQSQSMTVNGQLVSFRAFGSDILDTAVPAFTGVKKVGPLLGFNDEGAITVTQPAPLDLTVLALDYKVSVGQ